MTPFRLYPEEQHWWSFNDYGAVLAVMQRLQAKRVLEFGPGSSTLALIEGGATSIDALEDDPHWASVYRERLQARYPDIVQLHQFDLRDAGDYRVSQAWGLYDLALIDGPLDRHARVGILRACVEEWLVRAVLIPLDNSREMMDVVQALTQRPELRVEVMETGPLAGAFALIDTPAGTPLSETLQRPGPVVVQHGDPVDVQHADPMPAAQQPPPPRRRRGKRGR